ncbi:MAG TPA: NfeD family protein [Blastocatellia bacterium]|nr:NfeD family protein [Blastocatellia bacterium]
MRNKAVVAMMPGPVMLAASGAARADILRLTFDDQITPALAYGLFLLPFNPLGVLLLGVALALFILELKAHGFGILGLGGIIAAVFGILLLLDAPFTAVSLGLALAVALPFAVLLIVMTQLAMRARRAKVTTGTDGMLGLTGKAHTAIDPEGTIFVRGELWRARSKMKIARGEKVRVVGLDGLVLDVEAEKDETLAPRETSAISEL